MVKFTSILLILLCVSAFAKDNSLKNFETDYCTLFVEGTVGNPEAWKDCCYNHDLRYWFGGTKNDQQKSDIFLKECVRKRAGSFWANLIYAGVRTGHYSPIKNKYQWGWGWQENRDFTELSHIEKDHIREQILSLNLDPKFTEKFFLDYGL